MMAVWIGAALIGGAMGLMVLASRHRVDMAELGTVSQQWLAEQRANDRHYSER
jgi:hypothetical protein